MLNTHTHTHKITKNNGEIMVDNTIFIELENCESVWGKKKRLTITRIRHGKPDNQLTASKDKKITSLIPHYF